MFKRFYMAKYPHLSEDQACVYFIHCHKCPHDRDEYFKKGFLKIGMSGDLKARFHALDNDCHGEASMVKAVMLNTWREAWEREQSLHKQFQLLRFRGEWFYYTPYLKRWVKKFAQHIGPPAAVSTEPIAPDVEVKKEEREPVYNFGGIEKLNFSEYRINLGDDDEEDELFNDDRHQRSVFRMQIEDFIDEAMEIATQYY